MHAKVLHKFSVRVTKLVKRRKMQLKVLINCSIHPVWDSAQVENCGVFEKRINTRT